KMVVKRLEGRAIALGGDRLHQAGKAAAATQLVVAGPIHDCAAAARRSAATSLPSFARLSFQPIRPCALESARLSRQRVTLPTIHRTAGSPAKADAAKLS